MGGRLTANRAVDLGKRAGDSSARTVQWGVHKWRAKRGGGVGESTDDRQVQWSFKKILKRSKSEMLRESEVGLSQPQREQNLWLKGDSGGVK